MGFLSAYESRSRRILPHFIVWPEHRFAKSEHYLIMMENHEFCDSCPGCRPAIVGLDGRVLPNDGPEMGAVNYIWDNQTTFEERKAFIEVTLHNSRDSAHMTLTNSIMEKIKEALINLQKVKNRLSDKPEFQKPNPLNLCSTIWSLGPTPSYQPPYQQKKRPRRHKPKS